MKKFMAMVLILAVSLCGCGTSSTSTDGVTEVLSQLEYTLYYDMFYNGNTSEYVGTDHEVQGIFTTIYDRYNEVTRYYVWGHLDNTHCCDWQWELAVDDTADLPENGSLITVSGVYTQDEDALDGVWLTGVSIKLDTEYAATEYDLDMTTMSCTLERVQVYNMLYGSPEYFEGWSVRAYGRVEDTSVLQDPYYDGSWTMDVDGIDGYAIGTNLVVNGVYSGGVLTEVEAAES